MKPDELLKSKLGQDPENRRRILAALGSLGAVTPAEREQVSASPLVRKPPLKPGRQRGMGVVITITAYRRKLLDDDNLVAGAKALRDAIATSLGVDDADTRLKWEYRQHTTEGAEGTLVTISRVCLKSSSKSSKSS